MALKNRTESKAVVTAWAPILDLEAVHKPDLRDEVLDNCLFRKDVATSTTASGTTKTIEFLDVDYIEVTQSNNVAYTLNNVQQGEIKFLKITKTAAQTISFVNATDVSARKLFIDTKVTDVIYRITNKDGDLYLESINIDNDVVLEPITLDIGDWDMDTDGSAAVLFENLDKNQVKEVTAIIRNDADSTNLKLESVNTASGNARGTIGSILNSGSDVQIILARITGEGFDSVNYSTTSYNRGSCTIWVER